MGDSEVKERPIIFSGPMVRAILSGEKTMTRRIVKDQSSVPDKNQFDRHPAWLKMRCPYGQPGDRLWVRETFGYVSPDEFERPLEECRIEYRADLPEGCTDQPGQWPAEEARGEDIVPKWRPSIFMPRSASRLILEITSIRVERLQEITEKDAEAEGCFEKEPDNDAVSMFADLWESLHGPGSWELNPWVWVIEFARFRVGVRV